MGEPRFEVLPEKIEDPGCPCYAPGEDEPTGQFAWHFRDADGEIAFVGRRSLAEREDAHRAIRRVAADLIGLLYGGISFGAAAMIDTFPIVDLDEDGRLL